MTQRFPVYAVALCVYFPFFTTLAQSLSTPHDATAFCPLTSSSLQLRYLSISLFLTLPFPPFLPLALHLLPSFPAAMKASYLSTERLFNP